MNDDHIVFTEEALKAEDGKKVPLAMWPGGPIIGEGTLRYDAESGELRARFTVDDPNVAETLKTDTEAVIFKKG